MLHATEAGLSSSHVGHLGSSATLPFTILPIHFIPYFIHSFIHKAGCKKWDTASEKSLFLLWLHSFKTELEESLILTVLNYRAEGKIKHCRIKREGRLFTIGTAQFESLVELVEFYMRHPLYKGMKLKNPINEDVSAASTPLLLSVN